jgi:NADPH2:quinone reductase
LFHYISTRSELEQIAGKVLKWVASGELDLRIEHVYPLAEAQQAHIDLESRITTGKVVLMSN